MTIRGLFKKRDSKATKLIDLSSIKPEISEAPDNHISESISGRPVPSCTNLSAVDEFTAVECTHPNANLGATGNKNETFNLSDEGEHSPGMSIITTERLCLIANDAVIPLEIRNFIKDYLRHHGGSYIRSYIGQVCPEPSNSLKKSATAISVELVDHDSTLSLRPTSVRASTAQKTCDTNVNLAELPNPRHISPGTAAVDWPFYENGPPFSISGHHTSLTQLPPPPPSPVRLLPSFQHPVLMHQEMTLKRSDSLSTSSSLSEVPSLSYTAKSTCSAYSALSEPSYDLPVSRLNHANIQIGVPHMFRGPQKHSPNKTSLHSAAHSTRSGSCRVSSCSSYGPVANERLSKPMRSTRPNDKHQSVVSTEGSNTWRKTRIPTGMPCFELNNPNAYCGSRNMSGPYPCIPNRRSIRPDGSFKRESNMIPVSFSIDDIN